MHTPASLTLISAHEPRRRQGRATGDDYGASYDTEISSGKPSDVWSPTQSQGRPSTSAYSINFKTSSCNGCRPGLAHDLSDLPDSMLSSQHPVPLGQRLLYPATQILILLSDPTDNQGRLELHTFVNHGFQRRRLKCVTDIFSIRLCTGGAIAGMCSCSFIHAKF